MEPNDHYLAVKTDFCVYISVYLPTDYSNDQSERLFALSYKELGSCAEKIRRLGLPSVIAGNFNCNLSEPDSEVSPCTTIVKGLFSDFFVFIR